VFQKKIERRHRKNELESQYNAIKKEQDDRHKQFENEVTMDNWSTHPSVKHMNFGEDSKLYGQIATLDEKITKLRSKQPKQ
jgi:hypothetical protein